MTIKNLKLNAIAWKAGKAGLSYGMFCASLTEEEKKQIYREYEQLIADRQKEEEERLQRAKKASAARARRKKSSGFLHGSKHQAEIQL